MGSISLCTRWKKSNEALNESEHLYFYNNMKCVVWYILVTKENENKERLDRVCTGVTLNKNGYIVTSSICLDSRDDIQVRRVGEEDGFIKAEIVEIVNEYGLAILKVDMMSQYAEIGDCLNLNDGISVYSISHPARVLRYSIFIGRVISQLSGKEVLDVSEPELEKYCDNLSPELRFIQIQGFNSHYVYPISLRLGYEILGAPVFNSIGQVVGVIVACESGIDYAIPSYYLEKIAEKIQDASKEKSSQTLKRKSRGKSSRGGSSSIA